MNDFNLIVSSLVLAIPLPVSVAVLYSLMAGHLQLAPESAMASAIVERFDSEAERAEYHVALEARREIRRSAVMARYRHLMERELQGWDPRRAEPYRTALAASTGASPATNGATAPAPDPEPESVTDSDASASESALTAAPGTRQRRPALWRLHQAAHRQ